MRNAAAKPRIILLAAECCTGCLHTMGLLFLPVPCFSSVDRSELFLIYASGKKEHHFSQGVSCWARQCGRCLPGPLHQFAFGQPLKLGDASQHGAPGRKQHLAHQPASAHPSCLVVTDRELFPPLSPSLDTCIISSWFSAFYTLLSVCFHMHLVSKALSPCSVNPILLELHRVTVVAPGKLGEHRLRLSSQQGRWCAKQGPSDCAGF